MFNIEKIQEQAIGLVGFRDTTLDSTLLDSRSGLTFEAGSALVDVDVINDIKPASIEINAFLKDLIKNAFVAGINSIFSNDEPLDSGLLYPHSTEWENRNDLTGFIGYQINTSKTPNIAGIVNRLLFGVGEPIYYVDAQGNPYIAANGDRYAAESPIGTLKLYLFNTQMGDPIASVDITTVDNATIIKQVNWYLDYYSLGGMWYIGYFTQALPSTPVAVNYNLSYFRKEFDFLDIKPVICPNADSFSFRPKDVEILNFRPALNLDLTVGEDYTQIIISNEQRFARLLQIGVAISIADLAVNSYRSNRDERISKANALFELDGNRNNPSYPEHTGLLQKYNVEIKRLKQAFNPRVSIYKATL